MHIIFKQNLTHQIYFFDRSLKYEKFEIPSDAINKLYRGMTKSGK